jgi:hypothetical protein
VTIQLASGYDYAKIRDGYQNEMDLQDACRTWMLGNADYGLRGEGVDLVKMPLAQVRGVPDLVFQRTGTVRFIVIETKMAKALKRSVDVCAALSQCALYRNGLLEILRDAGWGNQATVEARLLLDEDGDDIFSGGKELAAVWKVAKDLKVHVWIFSDWIETTDDPHVFWPDDAWFLNEMIDDELGEAA